MPENIRITEVGLRDGLQNQAVAVPVEGKLALLGGLVEAGVRHVELTSFVRPDAVPQLADAAQLVDAAARDGLVARLDDCMALVPNMKGYERAHAVGVRSVALVLAVSETLNVRNIKMTLEQATGICETVTRRAADDGVRVRVYLAAAMGCPFDGPSPPARVHALAARMFDAGADAIAVADTIGAGHPQDVPALFEPLVNAHGAERIAAHFHDTRGLGSALAWQAALAGVRQFDASIGGLGGCPFAPGASGNVATEDLAFLFEQAGFATGIDVDRLLDVLDTVETLLGARHQGRVAPWLANQRRKRRASAPPINALSS
ncbi:hydroxymethylglutaryl-CoA lyase [Caballeronia temeraria]|uniref:Hydroxymethylglutaryl-CoA lyase n=1 Tax=Caballeronia temeraria TaxID=1777137 RepID=A0A158A164_9BURK|nr:hydroxymethylglutaryl-CoA lyase [Caballeronia temeraria]SAK51483.1 hydroxymethylglutaryl-CoA lyase [Caballeronia temeraria]